MPNSVKLPLLALAGLALIVAPALGARERTDGQAKLAKMLDGRVAGEARSCLPGFRNRNMQIIDKTAIVYRDGATVWVNVPRNPETLDDDDILVTRQWGSQLCRQDIVQTYERSGFFMNGVLFLGDFVPYRKAGS